LRICLSINYSFRHYRLIRAKIRHETALSWQYLLILHPFKRTSLTVSFAPQAIAKLPTRFGEFTITIFTEDAKEHALLVFGELDTSQSVLCRVHSECLTGDSLFSLRCDCGPQLEAAMTQIADNGSGVLIYLRQEGRDIGLVNKIKAYALQDEGADTVEANLNLGLPEDARAYAICEKMLASIHVNSVKLLTNNPRKVAALQAMGIEVSQRLPIIVGENTYNQHYLKTKRAKLGHLE
jgi:GTP cyclohydrolase II